MKTKLILICVLFSTFASLVLAQDRKESPDKPDQKKLAEEFFQKGRKQFYACEYADALKNLDEAVSLSGDNPQYLLACARCRFEVHGWGDLVKQDYNRAQKSDQAKQIVDLWLVSARMGLQNMSKIRRTTLSYLASRPMDTGDELVSVGSNVHSALKLLDQSNNKQSQTRADRVAALELRGAALFQRGELSSASRVLEEAVELDGTATVYGKLRTTQAIRLLAIISAIQGKRKQANNWIQRGEKMAAELTNLKSFATDFLARIRSLLEEHNEKFMSPEIQKALGKLAGPEGRVFESAEDYVERATILEANNLKLIALNDLRKAVKLAPKLPDVRMKYGKLLFREAVHDGKVQMIQAIMDEPNDQPKHFKDTQVLEMLLDAHLFECERKDAYLLVQHMIELAPDNAKYWDIRGQMEYGLRYSKRTNYAYRATISFAKASQLEPENSDYKKSLVASEKFLASLPKPKDKEVELEYGGSWIYPDNKEVENRWRRQQGLKPRAFKK